jgi:6 kDa early secretory antigenic target
MSSPDGIKVNFAQVEGASQQISATASQIEELLSTQHSQIQNLEQEWTGSTGSDFQNAKSKWETAANDLQQTLAKIGAAVSAAHEAYLQTESKNASAWQ